MDKASKYENGPGDQMAQKTLSGSNRKWTPAPFDYGMLLR